MAAGYSFLELMFVLGLVATLSAIAVPQTLASLDDSRTLGAARYLATRLQRARMEAVMRSASVGLKFTSVDGHCAYAVYVDGNGNGVRTVDIASGIDRGVAPIERLTDEFPHVDCGALPGLPPADPGGTPPGSDPVRLGASSIATFTPIGTSTTGSIYIRGARAQYVVRIFGDTGKTRVMKFESGTGKWTPQ